MKSAWRYFLRSKTHVAINLVGLTLALIVVLFIYLYVSDELSYDKWMSGHEQVVRLQPTITTADGEKHWATSEGFIIPAMSSMYPEIGSATRILKNDRELMIRVENQQHIIEGTIAADSTFFDVFPMTFVYGNKTNAASANGLVITRSVSKKLFGNEDPVGKAVTTDVGDYAISAVVEDVPRLSHFRFSVIIPLGKYWEEADQSRNMYAFYSYLRLKQGVDVWAFNDNTVRPWYSRFGYAESKPASERRLSIELHAMPVDDIHLHSNCEKEFEANGNVQVVSVFIGAGILLLVIAVINYINLSNAIATRRAKEVAVRKTIGASRRWLFARFMGESFFITSIAMLASVIIAIIMVPSFNSFVGKQVDLTSFIQVSFVGSLLGLWIVISFLAGVYPASILSSYDPISVLRSNGTHLKFSKSSVFLRHGFIVAQFTISAIMIVVSSVVANQMNFIESRDIGFDKNNVVVLQLSGDAREKVPALKSELERLGGVSSVSATSVIPGKRVVILMVRIPDIAGTRNLPQKVDDGTREMRVISVDADFVKTLGLKVMEGRDFSKGSRADSAGAFILNEAAVKKYNLQNPVGRPFDYTFYADKKGSVIGVLKDFNFASAHSDIEPVALHIFPPMYTNLCVRVEGKPSPEIIQQIESTWKSVTSAPFNWQFLDVTYDQLYKTEQTTRSVVSGFMTISILIAAMGLFGIVTLFAQQRLKEIGIRKVMGASQLSLMNRLSREYLLVIVIGNCLAVYPAFLVVSQWLQQFAFRIDLGVTPFLTSLFTSLVLALLATGWIVLKTARVSPVNILRYE